MYEALSGPPLDALVAHLPPSLAARQRLAMAEAIYDEAWRNGEAGRQERIAHLRAITGAARAAAPHHMHEARTQAMAAHRAALPGPTVPEGTLGPFQPLVQPALIPGDPQAIERPPLLDPDDGPHPDAAPSSGPPAGGAQRPPTRAARSSVDGGETWILQVDPFAPSDAQRLLRDR